LTGVPHIGQHLPGITQTVSPLSKQAGHLLPGTGSFTGSGVGSPTGLSEPSPNSGRLEPNSSSDKYSNAAIK
jgi:hypothetical protein